jgi:hypothetical protein
VIFSLQTDSKAGAIKCDTCTLNVYRSTFAYNNAQRMGAAIWVEGSGPTAVAIYSSVFEDNTAGGVSTRLVLAHHMFWLNFAFVFYVRAGLVNVGVKPS